MSVKEVLQEAINLDDRKSKEYGKSRDCVAAVMSAINPEGVSAQTPEEFARLTTYMHVLNKVIRYGRNLHRGGHMDSAVDMVNYSALLVERTCNENSSA